MNTKQGSSSQAHSPSKKKEKTKKMETRASLSILSSLFSLPFLPLSLTRGNPSFPIILPQKAPDHSTGPGESAAEGCMEERENESRGDRRKERYLGWFPPLSISPTGVTERIPRVLSHFLRLSRPVEAPRFHVFSHSLIAVGPQGHPLSRGSADRPRPGRPLVPESPSST